MWKNKWLLILIFMIVVALLPALLLKLGMRYMISMVTLVSIYTLAILSLDVALGYGGQINLGLQGFMAVGAYTVAVLTTKVGVPPLLAHPVVAMLMGILLSFIVAFLVSVPILRTIEMMPFSIVTLAFGLAVYMVISGSTFLGSTLGITGIPSLAMGPLKLAGSVEMYYFSWAVTFALIFFSSYMVNSQWGVAVRCICSSEQTAEVVGINVAKYRLEVFLLSATLGGVAGSLFAFHLRGLDPTNFDFSRMLLFLFALFLGGERSIWGTVIGATTIFLVIPELIGVLSNYWLWIPAATPLIYGVIFTLILFFLPGGLMGLMRGTGGSQLDRFLGQDEKRTAVGCLDSSVVSK